MTDIQQIRNLETIEANQMAALEATRRLLRVLKKDKPVKEKDNDNAILAKRRAQWEKRYKVKSA